MLIKMDQFRDKMWSIGKNYFGFPDQKKKEICKFMEESFIP